MTLISISEQAVGQEVVQTVNARDLHAFLEIKSEFRNWINNRIEQYSFIEKQDFTTTVKFYRGGKLKDYYLTLDMAKELAMVERNEKGKQARQYFIECERRAKQVSAPQIDYSDPRTILGVITHMQEELQNKDALIEQQTPKVIAYDHLTRSDGLFGLTEAAKVLEVRPKDLIDYLRGNDWVYRRAPGSPLLPYQDKIKKGLMDCPTITIQRPDGTEKVLPSTKITTKGLACLREQIHGGVQ
ncbi:antA/AntB antirepressor family protein [Bartonella sp. B30(2025)]